jgi:hypothetical protein
MLRNEDTILSDVEVGLAMSLGLALEDQGNRISIVLTVISELESP